MKRISTADMKRAGDFVEILGMRHKQSDGTFTEIRCLVGPQSEATAKDSPSRIFYSTALKIGMGEPVSDTAVPFASRFSFLLLPQMEALMVRLRLSF